MKRWKQFVRVLRKALLERLGLKIFSLAAAICLFSLVSGSEDAQRSVFVEVISLLPAPSTEKVLVSDLPDRIKITVRGSRSLINSLDGSSLRAVQIDLRDVRTRYYYIDASAFEVPAGLEVVQIAPASIPLRWEKRVRKSVPVQIRYVGATDQGTAVRKPGVAHPAMAEVEGPESELRSLEAVRTEAIQIENLGEGNYERSIRLEPLAAHSTFLSARIVTVNFEVFAKTAQIKLRRIPVQLPAPLDRHYLSDPATVDVTAQGPAATVLTLTGEALSAFVRADKGARKVRSGGAFPVDILGPPGVTLKANPAKVTVLRKK